MQGTCNICRRPLWRCQKKKGDKRILELSAARVWLPAAALAIFLVAQGIGVRDYTLCILHQKGTLARRNLEVLGTTISKEESQVTTKDSSSVKQEANSYMFADLRMDEQLSTWACGPNSIPRGLAGSVPQLPSDGKRKIIAVIPYMREVERLHVRFLEHYSVIDYFVVIEAPLTHSGQPIEPQFSKEACGLFLPYLDKVVHVITDTTVSMGFWAREQASRNPIAALGPMLGLHPSDVVLQTDVDEIPTASAITFGASTLLQTTAAKNHPEIAPVVRLELEFYYYNLRHKVGWWGGAGMLSFALLSLSDDCTLSTFRKVLSGLLGLIWCGKELVMTTVPAAGVHISYFASPELISTKIKSFAHNEYNYPQYTDVEKIKERIRMNRDLYDRNYTITLSDPEQDKLLLSFSPAARAALLDMSSRLVEVQEAP